MCEIWDDATGECIQVGPDRDGIDLIEIRSRDDTGHIAERMSFTKEQAKLVCDAILELLR